MEIESMGMLCCQIRGACDKDKGVHCQQRKICQATCPRFNKGEYHGPAPVAALLFIPKCRADAIMNAYESDLGRLVPDTDKDGQ